MKFSRYAYLFVFIATISTAAKADVVLPFDTAVVTGTSQSPGVWYTDRYAPAGFVSPVVFDGDNRLKQSIDAADGANSRPSGYSSAFYNTQGRKYDLGSSIANLQIDLFVPASWASTGNRMAGLWGTAFDNSAAVSAYPILEFTSDTATPRFRGWDGTAWTDMGLPTGFAYDQWYTLKISMLPGAFRYDVGDLTLTTLAATGSVGIGNVILQGHNTATGVNYDIYWDNLQASPVPLPAAAWMGLTLLGGVGGMEGIKRLRRA